MRHWTYIHWAECGVALYVGRTTNPEGRTRTHRSHAKRSARSAHRTSRWFPAVHRIEWTAHESEWAAGMAERQLIESLRPYFNVANRGNADRWEREDRRWVEATRVAPLIDRDVALFARHPMALPVLDALERAA